MAGTVVSTASELQTCIQKEKCLIFLSMIAAPSLAAKGLKKFNERHTQEQLQYFHIPSVMVCFIS
jgi:hypothetical protein